MFSANLSTGMKKNQVRTQLRNHKYTLVDMTWWKTTSRRRGIGIYLQALFKAYYDWQNTTPIWLITDKVSANEIGELKTTFRFGEISNEKFFGSNFIRTTDGQDIATRKVVKAISGSPFERPWSLLNEVKYLNKIGVGLTVIVHDLIPLKFKKEILNKWSIDDQINYINQIENLKYVSHIFVTGRSACAQVLAEFPDFVGKTSVIPFGEHEDWLKPPLASTRISPIIRGPYVITISGGEWRKNLKGTLQLFSIKFPKPWKLVVVCKLGRREKIKFQLLALEYGLVNRVIWAGEVSEEVKWSYLIHAKALLSLSFAEGLNLPVIEAKSVGIPTILLSDLKNMYAKPA